MVRPDPQTTNVCPRRRMSTAVIEYFTGGACKGIPFGGNGVCCYALKVKELELYGGEPYTTNNRWSEWRQ